VENKSQKKGGGVDLFWVGGWESLVRFRPVKGAWGGNNCGGNEGGGERT